MDYNLRCGRCGNGLPGDPASPGSADWNAQWEAGHLTRLICPDCQTPADSAAAEANAAELRVAAEGGTQFVADPVVCMTGTMTDPGTVLYGDDHLRRVLRTGQAENLWAIEGLPPGTRCAPTVGGVLIHPPLSAE
ncbi:hypothetical protein [Streptomyces nitrosporeus]|uniref:hypothetical protein n=1 Tax=Streptomyces nitrosporeus TaxID=28894 RepID=UPI00167ED1FB|nr:hypothetical protein [Streptomyces nitrosporeus]